ncbi:MAG: prephenate dehydratase [Bacteroidales bacterium]|nr:prephenate dehydratase [Bacteroidales bacterium]
MKKTKQKVVIQGFRGSYHEIAALRYFGPDIEVVPSLTFEEMFKMMAADKELSGIIAIENTVSGSILPNYTLIKNSGNYVTGECKLKISMNLMACPGQFIDDILEVRSHPLALMQCHDYFDDFPSIRLIDSVDTALSAKEISETGLKGAAVVASKLAAELYGLEIIASGIESNKRNFTRFLIIDRKGGTEAAKTDARDGINKASVAFKLPHRKGSLVELLSVFAKNDCSLTSIQSNPIIGSEWEYLFYADMVFPDYQKYRRAIDEGSPLCNELAIIGEYKEGKVFYD